MSDRANRFEAWALDHGSSEVRTADRRRVATDLFDLAGRDTVTEAHVEELAQRYRKQLQGAQRILAVEKVGREVLTFQEAMPRPTRPRDPRREDDAETLVDEVPSIRPPSVAPSARPSASPREQARAPSGAPREKRPVESPRPAPEVAPEVLEARAGDPSLKAPRLPRLDVELPPEGVAARARQADLELSMADGQTEVGALPSASRPPPGSSAPPERRTVSSSALPALGTLPEIPNEGSDRPRPARTPEDDLDFDGPARTRSSSPAPAASAPPGGSAPPRPASLPPAGPTSTRPSARPPGSVRPLPPGAILPPPAPESRGLWGKLAVAVVLFGLVAIVAFRPGCLFQGDPQPVTGSFSSRHLALSVRFSTTWHHVGRLDQDTEDGAWERSASVFYRGAGPTSFDQELTLVTFEKDDHAPTADDARTLGTAEMMGLAQLRDCRPTKYGERDAFQCTSFTARSGQRFAVLESYFVLGSRVVFARALASSPMLPPDPDRPEQMSPDPVVLAEAIQTINTIAPLP